MNIFGRKTTYRVKVGIALFSAILLSFFILLVWRPKQNDIPVEPYAIRLALTQAEDKTLSVGSVDTLAGYAPDYQTDMQDNYYLMKIMDRDKVLFTGKMPKSQIIVKEKIDGDDKRAIYEEKGWGTFDLLIPFYETATMLVFTDESGTEMLSLDLQRLSLPTPEPKREACGDGICADDENILMCYKDCSF
ncbi:hypothetical protein IPM65_03820 [Candidatus Roizmanbacteria bacterium]|nr:MAG: hypothetical protein IPM65_03820 [Candidatus Roizmanbacteria bacterium]